MAASFDGTASYLSRSSQLRKISDSDAGTILAWVQLDSGGDSSAQYIFSINGDYLSLQRNASNKFVVTGKNSAGATILTLTSSTSYTGGSTWYQVLASWDLSAGAGYLYVNRSSDEAGSPTLTNDTIDYTQSPVAIGAQSGGSNFLNGQLFDLVFWPGTYINISTQSNLIKFISSDGLTDTDYTPDATYPNPGPTAGTPKPVGYGADGDRPTGVKPSVMLSGSFQSNKGTGGAFVLNGTIDGPSAASTSSDSNTNYGPQTYRQSARYPTPGERWFDSEQSGFSYPRSKTFIERREGLTSHGLRLGEDERDDTTRGEYPSRTYESLIFPDREEDIDERDR